jgi:predicted HAD superfamily Cof-like phosphohydrolase
MTNFKMVEEFHRAFKPHQINIPFSIEDLTLCRTLISEESFEVDEACLLYTTEAADDLRDV